MATALPAILVQNSGVIGLLYFSGTSHLIHQQILLVLLRFISRVWSHVTSSIITILAHTSTVSCLNDCSCLQVGLCFCLHISPVYSIWSSQSDPFKVSQLVCPLCSKLSKVFLSYSEQEQKYLEQFTRPHKIWLPLLPSSHLLLLSPSSILLHHLLAVL